MKRWLATWIAVLVVAGARAETRSDAYVHRPEVREFIAGLVERHGFVEAELVRLFSRVYPVAPILEAIASPSEKVRSWQDYRALFLSERRIGGGVAFWKRHRRALERAEREFGVPAEYIVAIIGVETLYGQNTGRFRVIEALATLAFDYSPRATFFRNELEDYLLLARDEGLEVFALRGSYAGAFGIPQFMPGSARRYAVDYDRSGGIDLSRSATDAIGSVGNFLREHGWKPGAGVQTLARVNGEAYREFATGSVEARHTVAQLAAAGVEPASPLPADERVALIELATPGRDSEFRLGQHNFYVLTRYNRSALYAAAAHDLASAVRAAYQSARKAGQEPGK